MSGYLTTFPTLWQFSVGDFMDDAVRSFSRNNRETLSAIKSVAISAIVGINTLLSFIPWWAFIIIVSFLAYKVSGKKSTAALFSGMLLFIGFSGLWSHMLETLSIVIASVVLSLVMGFPLGILITTSRRAEQVFRPVLDLMQTMPAFVYLVPAILLFSTGKTPALMATTIYSIVPMIRMTSHGITHVDTEVVEAAQAFGSTKLQALVKVQIPQALPTIMTGVNQTIMMAMSMVVTCALIGANGLGMEILIATNRTEVGKALMPGISIVFVAIILDRLTQGLIKSKEVGEQWNKI